MLRGWKAGSPDFQWNLLALANFMRLSLLKGARAALSCAAWLDLFPGEAAGRSLQSLVMPWKKAVSLFGREASSARIARVLCSPGHRSVNVGD
jgi:hypothetical protein